ncbi:MAG: hypothetical protein A2X35_02930 [Elusimicrobia bacterium GWA2_61_42]|nr:MAG: hypothetical protein A2X35_02930 [Elusimicrobia bacterium GWA2_61_42]OGR74805.1 MAG: hypothetical protein A2X38_08565 [Elusimicrobia bacterium GWC2_61_25]
MLCLSSVNLYAGEDSGPELFFSVSRAPGYRCLAPVGARALDAAAVERTKADSVPALLDAAASLAIRRLNGPLGLATVSMRGFQSKQTAVLIDDVRLPADITGTVDLSVLPAAGLGKVEILPGAASSVYGANAAGGVVQLFTRRLSPGARLAQAGAEFSSYNGRAYTARAGAAGQAAEVFFAGASNSSGGFQQNSKVEKDSANGRASLALGAAGRLTVTGLVSRLKTGLPSGTPAPVSDWNGTRERTANSLTDWQTSRRSYLSGAWSGGGEKISLKADFSLSDNKIEAFQFGSLGSSKVTDKAASARATFSGTAVLGAESSASALASGVYGDHTVHSYGVFAQKTFSPARGLELTPGARLDKSGVYKGRVSPKLAAVYVPDEKWKLSASAGMAFQAPTFADLYNPWAAPAPGLKPETSLNSHAGVYYGAPAGWYAELGGYYSAIKDRIALDPLTWAAANLDAGFNYGLEAEAGFKPGSFTFSAGYARNLSKVKTGGAAYELMNFSPAHRVTCSAGLNSGSFALALAGRGVSEQYTGRGRTGLRLPEYWTFGLTASKALGGLELWGGISNLLDRRYAETADVFNGWFPQPGRTFSAGLKFSFA